jgi:hypothetical protein
MRAHRTSGGRPPPWGGGRRTVCCTMTPVSHFLNVFCMDGKVKAMRSSALFESCTAGALRELARLLDGIVVPAGTSLDLSGGRELHVVLDGSAIGLAEGCPIRMLNPGTAWGGRDQGQARSIVALTELTLLVAGPRTRRRAEQLCPALAATGTGPLVDHCTPRARLRPASADSVVPTATAAAAARG